MAIIDDLLGLIDKVLFISSQPWSLTAHPFY
jgi:hypothetical protein